MLFFNKEIFLRKAIFEIIFRMNDEQKLQIAGKEKGCHRSLIELSKEETKQILKECLIKQMPFQECSERHNIDILDVCRIIKRASFDVIQVMYYSANKVAQGMTLDENEFAELSKDLFTPNAKDDNEEQNESKAQEETLVDVEEVTF